MQARAEWRTAGDWLLAVAVALVAQTGLGMERPWSGSDVELGVSALALALPLVLRRRWPLATALLTALAMALQIALGGSLHFGSFVAVLVAAYATGRHAPGRPVLLAAATVLLVGVLGSSFAGADDRVENAVFPIFYVVAATVLGRVVRSLTRQAEDLRRLNEALARERSTASRLAVATERVRLARDLHDVVAHTLTVVVVQAELAEANLESEPDAVRRALGRVQEAGRRGLDDLRGMVRVLRSDDTAPEPGPADLPTLVAVLGEAGLDVELTVTPLDERPDRALGTELFRIVQEALTNVVKHSAATSARVRLTGGPGGTLLEVSDPGPALARGSSRTGGGHGLPGMAERVARFGGTVAAGPDADGGFRVTVRVPDLPSQPPPPASPTTTAEVVR